MSTGSKADLEALIGNRRETTASAEGRNEIEDMNKQLLGESEPNGGRDQSFCAGIASCNPRRSKNSRPDVLSLAQ
jgi:hypothetical protein